MYDDDPVQDAVGFGVSTAATVAKGAFRLGQINVLSGSVIGIGWLATCGLFFFAYALNVAANPFSGGTYNSQTSGLQGFSYCLACISMLGGLAMVPMSLGWLVNLLFRAGRNTVGARPRSSTPPVLTPQNDLSQDGLFIGEQIRWDQ